MHLPGTCLFKKITHSEKFAGSEGGVRIWTEVWFLYQALSPTQYSLSNPGEEMRQKKVEVSFQEPQMQEGCLSEGLAGINWELEGATQEIQTWHKYKPLTQAEISQFSGRRVLPWLSGAGLSREGGAATFLLSGVPSSCWDPVSPPGSTLFVDSGSLPSDRRKAFSL